MEVHVRNVPPQANDKSLRNSLRPIFAKLSIQNVDCQKGQGKTFASLTFLSIGDGQKFLARYGQIKAPDGRRLLKRAVETITFQGSLIYFEKSNRDASPFTLKVLRTEAERRGKHEAHSQSLASQDRRDPARLNKQPIKFNCKSVAVGSWDSEQGEVVFSQQLSWNVRGTAVFGQRVMMLTLDSGIRIDFRYTSTLEIATQDGEEAAVTFTMWEVPRVFEKVVEDPLVNLIACLRLRPKHLVSLPKDLLPRKGPDRFRLPFVDAQHEAIAGCCLVYRIALEKRQFIQPNMLADMGGLMESMKHTSGMPTVLHQTTRISSAPNIYSTGLQKLKDWLSSVNCPLPFGMKFQVQRLAQDGYLSPSTVYELLPAFVKISQQCDIDVAVNALRKFANKIPYHLPGTDAADFDVDNIGELLWKCKLTADKERKSAHEISTTSENVANIHRARVTPSSVKLHGPEPESNNRVLRRYPHHHGHFLRVQFCDEDGQPVRFNPRISNERILHGRFKDVLTNGIDIAERKFTFLGYSHSSLRAQSVWFYSPFVFEGRLQVYDSIIGDLGNFADIQSPAKCAARIGQTFSDTRTAVRIDPINVVEVPDVERNGRVFSDGVGTMSRERARIISGQLPKRHRRIPSTCFQIRYQGVKGMISLDDRLDGDVLVIRDSMIKFRGSNSADLEICEAAYKPLPMYFNRQFIKILEDMGVEDDYFLDLQEKEVERLRQAADNPLSASRFLSKQEIGETVHLPWLVTELAMHNLNFTNDGFLRDTVELARLSELRKLKHKTRIPVEKGYHLHGIMDETGFLEEDQIFCVVIEDGIPRYIVGKNLIISRAPALHPGDVQLVEGVMPPQNSSLMQLTNCICFSQKGSRDLPSKLSGGDLDGDRYYIMWDELAQPKRVFEPADYPRVSPIDIGRKVKREDMIEFFLQFYETDQLGRIAVTHRVKADQRDLGTNDPGCLLLAELHSTAVDFSKTGIPVDISKMPAGNRYRPDFEAPGPHVFIEKGGIQFDTPTFEDPLEIEDEDDEYSSYRYYESEKILGKLYRAIDEREIFEQIQARADVKDNVQRSSVIDGVWKYVQKRVVGIQWEYLMNDAADIRDMYEDCLYNIMTEYSQHPSRPLSELEAFTGNILGKTGVPTKHQRDLSKTMKEKFNEDSTWIVNRIIKNGDEHSDEALPMAIACLAVSLGDTNSYNGRVRLSSFKYVAAAVCLRELARLPGWEDLPKLDFFDKNY